MKRHDSVIWINVWKRTRFENGFTYYPDPRLNPELREFKLFEFVTVESSTNGDIK